jgi:hypothetical protein
MNPESDDLEPERFALNLEHARAAYANAQETVRFVDSKTGVLTGVLTVTTGLPFALLQFVVSSDSDRAGKLIDWYGSCGPMAAAATTIPLIIGIFFGTMSLLSSTNGLMARHPHKAGQRESGMPKELIGFLMQKIGALFGRRSKPTGTTVKLTSLFPLFPPHRTAEAQEKFDRLGRGEYDRREILAEYGAQLESIGTILHTKIDRNREAVRWFELQILSYLLAAAAALGVLTLCHGAPATGSSAPPATHSQGIGQPTGPTPQATPSKAATTVP